MNRWLNIGNTEIGELYYKVLDDSDFKKGDVRVLKFESEEEIQTFVNAIKVGLDNILNKKMNNEHPERVKKNILKKIESLVDDLYTYGLVDEVHKVNSIIPIIKNKNIWSYKKYELSLEKMLYNDLKDINPLISENRIKQICNFYKDTLFCIRKKPFDYQNFLQPLFSKYL